MSPNLKARAYLSDEGYSDAFLDAFAVAWAAPNLVPAFWAPELRRWLGWVNAYTALAAVLIERDEPGSVLTGVA